MSTCPSQAVVVLLTVALLGTSSPAFAQAPTDLGLSDHPRHLVLPPMFGGSSLQLPQRPIHRCCNLTGIVIGAAIGAGAGWWLTAHTCDAGDCTTGYVKTMAILGGIGSLVGAFANRDNTISISPSRHFGVSGVVTTTSRAAFARLAF